MYNQPDKLPDKEFRNITDLWQIRTVEKELDSTKNSIFTVPALLNIFNQSPCVTWILDVPTQKFNFISTNTFEYFGYNSVNYFIKGQNFHEETKHPDDLLNTKKFLREILQILALIPRASIGNYSFSFDYRIIKPTGEVVRILEQNSILQQDSEGNITHLLGVCNNITQWKRNETQLASLSSVIDKQYFFFTSDKSKSANPKMILSKRELEIVKLISEGHSSKYIADKLFISFHTVNTHRQKIIEKTNTKNTGGLVQFAVYNGLI